LSENFEHRRTNLENSGNAAAACPRATAAFESEARRH
jgi:hypothetical protein